MVRKWMRRRRKLCLSTYVNEEGKILVCKRKKGHKGNHACGPRWSIQWDKGKRTAVINKVVEKCGATKSIATGVDCMCGEPKGHLGGHRCECGCGRVWFDDTPQKSFNLYYIVQHDDKNDNNCTQFAGPYPDASEAEDFIKNDCKESVGIEDTHDGDETCYQEYSILAFVKRVKPIPRISGIEIELKEI